jgi:hypothetical protein
MKARFGLKAALISVCILMLLGFTVWQLGARNELQKLGAALFPSSAVHALKRAPGGVSAAAAVYTFEGDFNLIGKAGLRHVKAQFFDVNPQDLTWEGRPIRVAVRDESGSGQRIQRQWADSRTCRGIKEVDPRRGRGEESSRSGRATVQMDGGPASLTNAVTLTNQLDAIGPCWRDQPPSFAVGATLAKALKLCQTAERGRWIIEDFPDDNEETTLGSLDYRMLVGKVLAIGERTAELDGKACEITNRTLTFGDDPRYPLWVDLRCRQKVSIPSVRVTSNCRQMTANLGRFSYHLRKQS